MFESFLIAKTYTSPLTWQTEFVQHEIGSPQENIQHEIFPPQENIQHEVLPPMETISIASTTVHCTVVDSVSAVYDRTFDISNVTINAREVIISSFISGNNSITIPKSWGVTEFSEEGKRSLILSYFIKKHGNHMQGPLIEKIVMIDTNKKLRYYVYGRSVDPERC